MPGKYIVIAEKPSYAKLIVKSLPGQKFKYQDGYYEGERMVVTYGFGHLFQAYDIEDYTKETNTAWKLDILPFCPPNHHFLYKLKTVRNEKGKVETDPGVKQQFFTIKRLLQRPDITRIIHAGDADREGEILLRQIILNANTRNLPVYRLWVTEQNEKEIVDKINHTVPDSQFDNLANEGFARARTDWLDGMNLTRYVSILAKAPGGKPFRLGRVICAMVREIYDRDMAIQNFVPVPYFSVVSKEKTNGEEIVLRIKDTFPIDQKEAAEQKCLLLNSMPAIVKDIQTKRRTVSPGKLYSLTTLQNALLKRHKISLDDSKRLIQGLYEAGYITYPRTNTEYLGESEKGKVQGLLTVFGKHGYDLQFRDSKSIFDSSKVESHSAIIPTHVIPTKLDNLQQIVYETVRNRFLAVFCKEPCLVDGTTMTIVCGDEKFNLKGDVLVQKGFLKYDDVKFSEKTLPGLNIGEQVNVNFCPVQEETQPPKHYTAVTFNNFLENPFRKEMAQNSDSGDAASGDSGDDTEHYKAVMSGVEIGTVASRTDIIRKIIDNNYITEEKGTYKIAPTGVYLIETMEKLGININKHTTVQMSIMLKEVNKGNLTIDDAIDKCMENLSSIMSNRDIEITSCIEAGVVEGKTKNVIGKCPKCGGDIINGKFGPFCTQKCGLYIGKIRGKTLTETQLKNLFAGKKVLLKGLTSKKGTSYEAYVTLSGCSEPDEKGRCYINTTMEFPPKKKSGGFTSYNKKYG